MDKEQKKFFKNFGAMIRKFRLEKNWTLEDMQEHGFSAQHFQKIEAGKKAVNLYTVVRIAKALDYSLPALLKFLG